MGKARIISEQGEGQYTIEIIEARERAESAKNQAQSRISERRADIVGLESDIIAAQRAVDRAAGDQADAIAAYRAGNMKIGELSGYTQAVEEAASLRDSLLSQKRSKNMLIASDETLIARVNSLPALRQMQAWCADYTEELSGEVGTAEVPGEIGQVIIKPGFDSNSWSASDGAMQPALAGTPAGTFYNLAMLPGWQKWRPTFRVATITAIDGDQCDIDLDGASSSQGFGVNAESSYSDVPILYMDCNGGAFEEEDRVLVAFAGNVDGPTVVGFESSPRGCLVEVLAITAFAETGSAYGSPIREDGPEFYKRHKKEIDSGKKAVACIAPKYEKGEGAYNYLPDWAAAILDLDTYETTHQNYITAYEMALTKLKRARARNVVFVDDISAIPDWEDQIVPQTVIDELYARGVERIDVEVDGDGLTENWIPLIAPYFR